MPQSALGCDRNRGRLRKLLVPGHRGVIGSRYRGHYLRRRDEDRRYDNWLAGGANGVRGTGSE